VDNINHAEMAQSKPCIYIPSKKKKTMYLHNIKNNRKQMNNFDWCHLNMGCVTHLLLMGEEVVTLPE